MKHYFLIPFPRGRCLGTWAWHQCAPLMPRESHEHLGYHQEYLSRARLPHSNWYNEKGYQHGWVNGQRDKELRGLADEDAQGGRWEGEPRTKRHLMMQSQVLGNFFLYSFLPSFSLSFLPISFFLSSSLIH